MIDATVGVQDCLVRREPADDVALGDDAVDRRVVRAHDNGADVVLVEQRDELAHASRLARW